MTHKNGPKNLGSFSWILEITIIYLGLIPEATHLTTNYRLFLLLHIAATFLLASRRFSL
ncbi:MAG: hypothetical protein N3B16_06925 [Candidatus Aminicenantes bacterium]|nr:hypothetical protein [Candidatus Aminicenantes bacterium]